MNRFKKEEIKRKKPFPSGSLSEEQFRELVNARKEGRKPNLKKEKQPKKQ